MCLPSAMRFSISALVMRGYERVAPGECLASIVVGAKRALAGELRSGRWAGLEDFLGCFSNSTSMQSSSFGRKSGRWSLVAGRRS